MKSSLAQPARSSRLTPHPVTISALESFMFSHDTIHMKYFPAVPGSFMFYVS